MKWILKLSSSQIDWTLWLLGLGLARSLRPLPALAPPPVFPLNLRFHFFPWSVMLLPSTESTITFLHFVALARTRLYRLTHITFCSTNVYGNTKCNVSCSFTFQSFFRFCRGQGRSRLSFFHTSFPFFPLSLLLFLTWQKINENKADRPIVAKCYEFSWISLEFT